MAYVPVPKDLTKVKTKVALNLTKRQLIFFSLAAVVGLSLIHIYKDTGKKIYTTEVYANRIEFAGAKMVDRPPFPEDAEGFLEIPEGMEEEMPFR